MRNIGDGCEEWNIGLAKSGLARCAPRFCPQDSKAGSWNVPTLKVSINAGNSKSGSYGSYPGDLGDIIIGQNSLASSGQEPSQPNTNVSVNFELTIPLSKNPSTVSCFNPLSQAMIEDTYKRIMNRVDRECGGAD